MADLIDRMTFHEHITGRPKLSNHAFNAYLILYALGLATRQEIVTAWDLEGDEAAQAGSLADEIDNQPDAHSKHRFVDRANAVAMLLDRQDFRYVSDGIIDKPAVKVDLGIL